MRVKIIFALFIVFFAPTVILANTVKLKNMTGFTVYYGAENGTLYGVGENGEVLHGAEATVSNSNTQACAVLSPLTCGKDNVKIKVYAQKDRASSSEVASFWINIHDRNKGEPVKTQSTLYSIEFGSYGWTGHGEWYENKTSWFDAEATLKYDQVLHEEIVAASEQY